MQNELSNGKILIKILQMNQDRSCNPISFAGVHRLIEDIFSKIEYKVPEGITKWMEEALAEAESTKAVQIIAATLITTTPLGARQADETSLPETIRLAAESLVEARNP